MAGLIPIGRLVAAGDLTTGANIRKPNSDSGVAVDERIAPVAAAIIAADPTILAAAVGAIDEGLVSGAVKRQTVLNVGAAVPGEWATNLCPIPVPFPAPAPSTGWGHGGATAGVNSRVATGGPDAMVAPAFYRRTFSATGSGVNFITYVSPAVAEQRAAVSMSGRGSWAGRHCIQVAWRNADGTDLRVDQSPWTDVITAGKWNRIGYVPATATPAGTTQVQLRYVVEVGGASATPGNGDTLDGTLTQVETGTIVHPPFTGRTELAFFNSTPDQSASTVFIPAAGGSFIPQVRTVSPILGAAQYTTIQAAVDASAEGDTVLIFPGLYVEQVSAWSTPNLHLLGVSKDACIIRDSSGAYSTPPLEIGSGSVRNLTLIEDHAEAGSNADAFEDQRAYTIHADNYESMVGGTLSIENCRLINTRRAALGMGTYQGTRIILNNVDVWSGVPVLAGDRKRGALYFHNAHATGVRTDQHFEIHNSRVFCDDVFSVWMGDSSSASGFDSEMDVLATNTTFWSEINGKGAASLGGTGFTGNLTLHPASHGNTLDVFNAA